MRLRIAAGALRCQVDDACFAAFERAALVDPDSGSSMWYVVLREREATSQEFKQVIGAGLSSLPRKIRTTIMRLACQAERTISTAYSKRPEY